LRLREIVVETGELGLVKFGMDWSGTVDSGLDNRGSDVMV